MKFDLIVYDFDGVMTDNRVLVMEDGKEGVFCNRDDGWAIWKIKELNMPQIILSAEKNPVVQMRANKLKIPCIQGCLNKVDQLVRYCNENCYELRKVLYVGNGLNDLEVMKIVGHPIAPKNSHPDIKNIAGVFVTEKNGGEGVLLEVLTYLQESIL